MFDHKNMKKTERQSRILFWQPLFSLLSYCSELPTRPKIENIGNWAKELCGICGIDNSRLPTDLNRNS